MFGGPFYFGLIRKYVILMGTLVNNIKITRTDKEGNVTALLKVPVTYAPKDKMLARVIQDTAIDRQTAVTPLPLISFEMGKMSYDGSRKLPTINKVNVKNPTDADSFKYQYNAVPYNIEFKVYIYVKNAEDGSKIVEQILPYFTPDWTTTVNLIPEVGINMDIPILLNSITHTDTYDGQFKDRRAIIWTLDFVLKGYIYGPVRKGGIIKFVKSNFFIPDTPLASDGVGITPVSERVTVQPGLTALGMPTTKIDETIPYSEIEVDDDYGYVTIVYNEDEING
jgi:hypothetical protein